MSILLVHGAWHGAWCWEPVIDLLPGARAIDLPSVHAGGGFADDVAAVRAALDGMEAPVTLVGHSYGGAVISNAAVGVPNVKALVYIAAVAPDEGESQLGIFARFPGSQLGPSTITERKSPGGVDQYVDRRSFRAVFAAGEPAAATVTMAATQRPLAKVAAAEKSGPPAWRTIPSWFMVATEDQAIPPAAERFMAKRARAHTVEVRSPHFAMLSHPAAVTKLILAAAGHEDRP
jgi:pimeloyl-ACP methyl ester carboxylesterase